MTVEAGCKPFLANKPQLIAWRAARDDFSKFYRDVGTIHFDPSAEKVEQAKGYASKLYFWTGEYDRLKCGGKVAPSGGNSPTGYDAPPPPDPNATPTDWLLIVKWTVGGLAGLYALKTVNEIFGKGR